MRQRERPARDDAGYPVTDRVCCSVISSKAADAAGRKAWIENRLEELAQIFAVSAAGFSIMDNHLHVLVRLDLEVA